MIYLIASIVTNAFLGIIFRFFGEYEINNRPAIVVNYFVCFLVGLIVSGGDILDFEPLNGPWTPYILVLSFLFIFGFNIVATTVQLYSVTIASIMQKMSLVVVAAYAIIVYGESLNLLKIIGLALGLISVYLIGFNKNDDSRQVSKEGKKWIWIFPLLTFVISGMIDTLFFQMDVESINAGHEISIAAYLFLGAGIIGVIALTFDFFVKKNRYQVKDIYAGIVLGILNFFTILFIQKMLNIDWDGSVTFPINNIGILLMASLFSYFIFKETFDNRKKIGLVAAVITILFLSFA